ncbi:tyrosine-type recombinase/integrase [Sphingobacterium suaedae]|uniref:Tyrosine-type recombinase/integrase n=1 Tax=Sphingobacterium suaedae TaxID=1686402 RepID=A0ABW5KLE4_9SPHI
MKFNFILDRHKAKTSAITLCVWDHQGLEHRLKTPLRIAPAMWDVEKCRPMNIYLKPSKRVNMRLNRIKIAVHEYLNDVRTKRRKFSLMGLGRVVAKSASEAQASYPEGTLLYFVDMYIRSRSHLISNATHKRYVVFQRLLERFEGYQQKNLYLKEVNAEFVQQFMAFGELEHYTHSTISRSIHFIRTVLNFLEKRGMRTFVYELEIPKQRKINRFVTLSEDELVRIDKMEVPEHLKAAKDWLVISCYTGQRVSDFLNFNMDMLEVLDGQQCLSFVQQKTHKNILLPLHPAVSIIMARNGANFPARISPQRYNEAIKEVAKLAGINALIQVFKRRGYRSSLATVPKWEAITSHIGRRSFASNFYGKIPTALLMEATGHSSEQMFQRYISNVDTERTRTLGNYLEEAYKRKFLVA